ncbi:MAG: nitrous oxide-stimulated promoter family protein [Phocaeicola sp.]
MSKQKAGDKRMVSIMIERYCTDHHQPKGLCETCAALERYAHQRIERCPLGEKKTVCQKCTIHCYSPQKREEIRTIMRYSGRRILFRHPIASIRHLLQLFK